MAGFMTGFLAGQAAEDTHMLNQQKIEENRRDLAADKQFRQLLQKEYGKGTEKPQSITESARLSRLADLAAQSGSIDKAQKLSAMAAQARIHEANASYKETQNDLKRAQAAEQIIASNPQSQEEFDAANMIYEQITGEPSPLAGVPFTPENMKAIQAAIENDKDLALSASRRARLPLIKQQTNLARAKELKTQSETVTEETTKRDLQKAQTRAADARAVHLTKNGGSRGATKVPALVKPATDLIVVDYDITPEEARTEGRKVAERAVAILNSHPGLSATEATAQAYQEARDEGQFDDYMPMHLGAKRKPSGKGDVIKWEDLK
jgi:hypothetical protein